MPKTLLAVDDSATMRKVLEITFSGEDFTVITADSSEAALGKLGEKPDAVVIDTSLGGGNDDGYALARDVRKKAPGAAIVLLASKYTPYDAGKAKDAGADDYMDKPFDTQLMIDKVRKAMLDKGGAPAEARAPSAAPAARPVSVPAAAAPAPAPAAAAAAPARTGTLMFGDEKPAAARPASAAPPAVAASVNGHLSGKLTDLGLNPSQVEAVMALSREVVERVCWEVVPQMAEALIKEEIQRLMKP